MKTTSRDTELAADQTGGIEEEVSEFDPLRTPYEVNEMDFPWSRTLEEQFVFLLRYAILAPSSYNTQPWQFEVGPDGIAVYADYGRRLPVVDPGNRELLMSVGAAIANLRVAASHFGFACRVDYNHSGDSERPLAFASLTPMLSDDHAAEIMDALFPSITRRHTNRNPFLVTRIPEAVQQRLRVLAADSRAGVYISTDGMINQRAADLVAGAERMLQADPTYRQELSDWIRPNWTQRPDGITGAALGVKGVTSALAPWATKVLDLGRLRAAAQKNLCVQAPGLIIIYGEDSVPVWLEAGELLERLLLTITREGMQYSFFNMPIEIPQLRLEMRALAGLSAWPQLLLRIGYCLEPTSPTPRRPVQDVLVRKSVLKHSFFFVKTEKG
jgi:hypothetical protein